MDQYIIEDTSSAGGSWVEENKDNSNEDAYTNSILVSTQIKEPEDLIDADLLNLLNYIKRLKQPTDE